MLLAATHASNVILQRSLLLWRDFAHRSRRMRRVLVRNLSSLWLHEVFMAWLRFLQQRRKERNMAQVRMILRRSTLRCSLTRIYKLRRLHVFWRHWAGHLVGHMNDHMKRRVFHGLALHARRLRVYRRVLSRMLHLKLLYGFSRLFGNMRRRQQVELSGVFVSDLAVQHEVRRFLQRWRAKYRVSAFLAASMQPGRWAFRSLDRSFRGWRQHAAERKAVEYGKIVKLKCDARYARFILTWLRLPGAKAFRAWKWYRLAMRTKRRQYENSDALWKMVASHAAVRHWRHIAHARGKISFAKFHFIQRGAEQAFHALRAIAKKRKQRTEAWNHFSCRLIERTFDAWTALIKVRRGRSQQAMELFNAAQYRTIRCCFEAIRIASEETKIRRRKLHAILVWSDSLFFKQLLERWRIFSKVEKRLRLAKGAVLRLERKRLQGMLYRHWCGQYHLKRCHRITQVEGRLRKQRRVLHVWCVASEASRRAARFVPIRTKLLKEQALMRLARATRSLRYERDALWKAKAALLSHAVSQFKVGATKRRRARNSDGLAKAHVMERSSRLAFAKFKNYWQQRREKHVLEEMAQSFANTSAAAAAMSLWHKRARRLGQIKFTLQRNGFRTFVSRSRREIDLSKKHLKIVHRLKQKRRSEILLSWRMTCYARACVAAAVRQVRFRRWRHEVVLHSFVEFASVLSQSTFSGTRCQSGNSGSVKR